MIFTELPDQFPKLHDLFRIQAGSRFIQYQCFRFSDHRLGKPASLPVSFGQIPDQAVLCPAQVQCVHHISYLFTAILFRHFLQPAHK